MKVKIAFTTPRFFSPFSALIRYFEGVNFSHCVLIFEATKVQRELIYESGLYGVAFRNTDLFIKHNKIVEMIEIDVTSEERLALWRFSIDNLGKKYGYLSVFGHLLQRALGKFLGIKIGLPFKDGGKTYFCSELLGEMLRKVYGFDMPNMEDFGPLYLRDELVAQIEIKQEENYGKSV